MLLAIIIIFILLLIYFTAIPQKENLQDKLEYYDFYKSDHPYICMIAGTHGNEPAGTIYLRELVNKLRSNPEYLHKGHIRIVPAVNTWGLDRNIRYNEDYFGILPKSDINRNYNSKGGTDPISSQVVNLTKGADLLIDLHEGWGYHKCQPQSIGSTLTPSDHGVAPALSAKIVQTINKNIISKCKLFQSIPGKSCEIDTTLGCYAQKNKIPYILMETTGQENIQPIPIRTKQIEIATTIILDQFRMI